VIRHSERNDRPAVTSGLDRPVELIQMWVVPDENEVSPGYEQTELDPNRHAAFHVARLETGQSVTVPDAPYAHV